MTYKDIKHNEEVNELLKRATGVLSKIRYRKDLCILLDNSPVFCFTTFDKRE